MLINQACELKGQFNIDINGMCTGQWCKLGLFIVGLHHHLNFDFGKSIKIHKAQKMLAGCDKIVLCVVFIK